MHQNTGQGQGRHGLLQWHELLNMLKLNPFPTAVTTHTCLYSLAFEVLRGDVVLVRELGVPPLARDSAPYGADGAAVTLTLPANTRCGLSCRLCAVHGAFLCRPRQEVLFHSLKNGSGCQVWTPHYWWSHGLHDAQNMVIAVLWWNCQCDYSIILSSSHLQHPPKIQHQNKCQTLCSLSVCMQRVCSIFLRETPGLCCTLEVRRYSWLLFQVQQISFPQL